MHDHEGWLFQEVQTAKSSEEQNGGSIRGVKIPTEGPREEGRETSTDSVLINRDGFTRSHPGVVSGGNQSEDQGFVS